MLTVITATLNAAQYLERALASVSPQGAAIQHLVIDGGSTDGTVEICRRSGAVELVVAPGCSLYEAWNIGIERATAAAIMFLNADDELTPGAVSRVEETFVAHPDAEIVAGRARMLSSEEGDATRRCLTAASGGELDVRELAVGVPAINAMAFRRSVFGDYGPFETSYRVAGDRAWLLHLALAPRQPKVASIDACLYIYYVHAGSLTLHRNLEQRLRIARDHVALARNLLACEPSASSALWLRHMRRREAAVAGLRCLAAGRPGSAWEFSKALFGFGPSRR